MKRLFLLVLVTLCSGLGLAASRASAQTVETVGSRALGMGGAFVAVATDSSASWWNPGALAAGPFLDTSLGQVFKDPSPWHRVRTTWFAVGTPPLGLSNYRFNLTSTQPFDSTTRNGGNGEQDEGLVPVHSWQVSQWGVTFVQTILPGIHIGTTLKYLRGTVRAGETDSGLSGAARLDAAEVLSGGRSINRFDLDVGVLAVAGPVRLGALMRNLREPEFGSSGPRLPRQLRLGAAFDAEVAGGPALVVSVDADAKTYMSVTGKRRVVAAGVEQWLNDRRVGVRAGVRQNRVGDGERVWTAGASVRLVQRMYLDGYISRWRETGEQGWGLATRLSY
jgi:hypothetical protein